MFQLPIKSLRNNSTHFVNHQLLACGQNNAIFSLRVFDALVVINKVALENDRVNADLPQDSSDRTQHVVGYETNIVDSKT
jgi:hypothetical protein